MKIIQICFFTALILNVTPAFAILDDDETDSDPVVSSIEPLATDEARLNRAHDLLRQDHYREAQDVLKTLEDDTSSIALAYWGYSHRKLGNIDMGLDFYDRALNADPDNILARSYLGEAFVEMNDLLNARDQLKEIRERGGKGTAAEKRLKEAINGQKRSSYGR